jgi:hypothetical protein
VGKPDKPNTRKKIWFAGITIFTLKDGFITEEIAEEDGLIAFQQLGWVPPPNPGKEIPYDSQGNLTKFGHR